jgi:AcrR family transcriptional regulator
MAEKLRINKHGQALGRKGHDTRLRMMEAACQLLTEHSPVELTAVSIAKAANTSSATFYLYFEDVKDLLYALSEAAEADMAGVHQILDEPWNPQRVETEHAARVVHAFALVWDKHRPVLRFRNLEADRGDERFETIRLRTSLRIVKRFGDHILQAYPSNARYSKRDAMAEASVLVAAMERCAAVDPNTLERGVGADAMWSAMARVVARTLTAHASEEIKKPLVKAAKSRKTSVEKPAPVKKAKSKLAPRKSRSA